MTSLRAVLLVLCAMLAAPPVAALPLGDVGALPPTAPPSTAQPVAAAAAEDLRGTLRITAGDCDGAAVSGSFFRMVQPGGDPDEGPFVENSDSPCADQTYTPLQPGADGGLTSGAHQPQPDAPFDTTGNGTATRIVQPAAFFGVDFAVATNPSDPQTGTTTPAPVLRRDGATLSGDLRAVGVAWNRQHFNQGAPKPDGSTPGATRLPSGTVDAATGAAELTWASTIVGGPFNNFTGVWQLAGTFDGDLGEGGTPEPTQPPTEPPAETPAPADGAAASAPVTPRTGPALPAALGASLLAAGLGLRSRLRPPRRSGHA